jgi:hypothetical protein
MLAMTRRPVSRPGPRNEPPDVRFALSYVRAPRDVAEAAGEIGRVLLAFDHARARDQHERAPATNRDVAQRERSHEWIIPAEWGPLF